jgi:hypothetical protein
LTSPTRLRPYRYQLFLLAYTPLGLYADAHVANVYQQYALGVLTFGVLFFVLRFAPREQRRQVWLAVVIATLGELYFSLGVGLYRYRFDNVPLYVPAGHGLVYFFALTAAATPLMLRRRRLLVGLALGLATAWALLGVTVLPLITGRLDMTGALLWPIFAYFTLRSRQAPVYAAAFLMTSVLELFGTGFHNWTWQAIAPISHLHQGNPPSVIAGAYCLLDAAVMRLTKLHPLRRFSPSPRSGEGREGRNSARKVDVGTNQGLSTVPEPPGEPGPALVPTLPSPFHGEGSSSD